MSSKRVNDLTHIGLVVTCQSTQYAFNQCHLRGSMISYMYPWTLKSRDTPLPASMFNLLHSSLCHSVTLAVPMDGCIAFTVELYALSNRVHEHIGMGIQNKPSLILRSLKSLANFSSSRIWGESMSGGSSGGRLFLRSSCLMSPRHVSSVSSAWGSGGKVWLSAHGPPPRLCSGNLYRHGAKPPFETNPDQF